MDHILFMHSILVANFFLAKNCFISLYLFWKKGKKANKKDKKYLEKTLKTWKNYGKIMEFCWSAAVGTL